MLRSPGQPPAHPHGAGPSRASRASRVRAVVSASPARPYRLPQAARSRPCFHTPCHRSSVSSRSPSPLPISVGANEALPSRGARPALPRVPAPCRGPPEPEAQFWLLSRVCRGEARGLLPG